MKFRECKCLECGYEWDAEVVYSDVTTNICGERTNWCPMCGTKNVVSGPVKEVYP